MSLKNVEKIADPDPVDYINLSAELEPMDELDQQYRPNTEGEKGLKKQRKNDKQNFKTIAKCYKKYGPFYGSKLRGEAWPALRIVLVHRFADKSKRDRSHDFFVNEVKAGHIDARSYADIYDNYIYDSTQVYGMHTLFFCRDTLFVFNLNEDYKKQLNKNRSEIFLEDIDAFHEKMIWQWQNETKFRFGLIWEIMPYGDQKAEEIANEYLNKMGSCASSYSVYTKN
jgi:hypothetical protein